MSKSHMAIQVSIEEDRLCSVDHIKPNKSQEPHVGRGLYQQLAFAQENMNPILDQSTCSNKEDHEKVISISPEPQLLLDESWFFGNTLLHTNTKPIMSRCYSDPYPSSSILNKNEEEDETLAAAAGKSIDETFSSLQKLPQNGENKSLARRSSAGGLVRTPSLLEESSLSLPEESSLSSPSSSQVKRRTHHHHHRIHRGNSLTPQTTSVNSLSRAPSLPASIRREEEIDQDEEESDFSMSKLIRQASLNRPAKLPPRYLPKGSSSTPKQRPRRRPVLESVIPDSPEGMIRKQNPIRRSKLTKSSSDLASQELQGLRDLSIKFDRTESETIGELEEKKLEHMGKSSSYEKWEEQNQSLDNSSKKSMEDMKAQIRFWARAVASNVR